MRKLPMMLAAMLLLSAILFAAPYSGAAEPPPIGTFAQSAALIDVESGRIVYSHEGDKRMRIASLTKIMTAIVAIEHGKLSGQVTVGKRAYGKEGSSIYLRLGEKMSLHHMLYGLMLRSGNDAATAIAEHVGGSVEGFAVLMNEKARLIGMDNSRFMNPHGLDEEGHYSTANDMAKLTAYALNNPVFRDIVKTKVKRVPNPYEKWDHTWRNKNKMLSLYDGADGVKTGYTKLSGRCLVSSATREGQQFAVVTLNDPNDWSDHSNLLDYGFKHFPEKRLVNKGDPVAGHPFVAGTNFNYALTEEETANVKTKIELVDQTSIQYALGERGKLHFILDGRPIGAVPLFDADSPRLQVKEQSAFKFKASETFPEKSNDYLSVLLSVFRALFGMK
jgi:D-alanyl-D-alanine carboxypeptidase (penicillin-binding protein 5/6)